MSRVLCCLTLLGLALFQLPGAQEKESAPGRSPTLFFVVRHAEKDLTAKSDDPELSEKGGRRAKELARLLGSVPLRAVYSTDYRRTRSTALPAAQAAGLEVTPYAPKDSATLARGLAEKLEGGAVLIVGHSNTVPAVLEGLGLRTKIALGEGDYDSVFCVAVAADGSAQLARLHFGEAQD